MAQSFNTELNFLLERSLRLVPPSILVELTATSADRRALALRQAADIISYILTDARRISALPPS